MKNLTKQEKHEQCIREIRGTLVVVAICCAWHILSAFLLNGSGLYFLGMPAWFSVSTLGTIVLSLLGVWYLLKHVFIDFEYDDEEEGEYNVCRSESHSWYFCYLPCFECDYSVLYSVNGREVNSMYPLRKSFLLAGEI